MFWQSCFIVQILIYRVYWPNVNCVTVTVYSVVKQIIVAKVTLLFFLSRAKRVSTAARTTDLHEVPDTRTRKGIPLQPLSDAPTQDRDCTRAVSHRKANQDLVPKPAHEVKERASCCEGDKRASPQGKRRAGQNEAAATREAGQARGPTSWPPRHPPSWPHEDAHRQRLQRPSQSEQGPHVRRFSQRIGNPDWFCII